MKTIAESVRIEDLLEEADDLVRQINADVLGNLREEHRLHLEAHTRELERIKLALEGQNLEDDAPKTGSLGDGMHQAIQDIVTAMRDMKAYLT
ncbi:MAG: hypothetical protein V1793_23940 [Pseudomonadota bacterium]